MFFNRDGRPRPDAELIAEEIAGLSDMELNSLPERDQMLRDVINSFNARLETLSDRDRNAIRCVLYKKLADVIFDHRLSIETRCTRQKVSSAQTRNDKLSALREFQAVMQDVMMLHDIN